MAKGKVFTLKSSLHQATTSSLVGSKWAPKPNRLGVMAHQWNTLREGVDLSRCELPLPGGVYRMRPSACGSILCPMCVGKWRRRVFDCLAVWAYREPGSRISVLSYTVEGEDPGVFLDLFEPDVRRKMQTRTGEQALATITSLVYMGRHIDITDDETWQPLDTWSARRFVVIRHTDKPGRRRTEQWSDDDDRVRVFDQAIMSKYRGHELIHKDWDKNDVTRAIGYLIHHLGGVVLNSKIDPAVVRELIRQTYEVNHLRYHRVTKWVPGPETEPETGAEPGSESE